MLNDTRIPPLTSASTISASESHPGTCAGCGHAAAQVFLQAPDRYHGRQEIYRLLRCPVCSLVWLAEPPSPKEMDRHYGAAYDRAVAAAGDEPNRWRGRWATLAQWKSGGAILDLGCSSGAFLAGLPSSWKRYGIEMSEVVAERARARAGAEVFVGDILDAPFPHGMFDAVTCFHVFEHLYQPREILARVSQWLKPGGVFFTMMPNIDSAACRIFGSYWYGLELPRHLFHYSPKSLRLMAHSVGLEELSLTTKHELFIENSTRYLLDDGFRSVGIRRRPLAESTRPTLLFRVVRKAFRVMALPILNRLGSLAGDGESIHAIFQKVGSN